MGGGVAVSVNGDWVNHKVQNTSSLSWLSSIPHYMYQVYYTARIGRVQFYTHLVRIYVLYAYSSIRGTLVSYDVGCSLPGIYLVFVCDRRMYICVIRLSLGRRLVNLNNL